MGPGKDRLQWGTSAKYSCVEGNQSDQGLLSTTHGLSYLNVRKLKFEMSGYAYHTAQCGYQQR
jgi:hypothetical protein